MEVPILSKAGPLPQNLGFKPEDYQALLMQRMKLYLSPDKVIVGSMNEEPTRDVGPWFGSNIQITEVPIEQRTPSWFVWDETTARYQPAIIGLVSGKFGITINAAPTAHRRQVLQTGFPGTIALLTDVYVPRPTVIVGEFVDGISIAEDKTYQSGHAKFHSTDVGLSITGTNIPPNTTIQSVTGVGEIELSIGAEAAGTDLDFVIHNRTHHVIDASRSNDFILTLSGNTAIQPITSATLSEGQVLTVAIINRGTSYTVNWNDTGNSAANYIMWNGGRPPIQPLSSGADAIGIYTIRRIVIAGVTQHIWGESDTTGFNNTAEEPLTSVEYDPYYGSDEDIPPLSGGQPYNLP